MNPVHSRLAVLLFASILLAGPAMGQDGPSQTLTLTTESASAKSHFAMGMHDIDNVFFNRAARHFEQAAEADPSFSLARFMHARWVPGVSNTERRASMAGILGNLTGASTAELLLATGILEQFDGNAANARALYGAVAELVPDDQHVAFYHASLVGAGGSTERIQALRSVSERFPEQAGALNTLAYGLYRTGDEVGGREAVTKYMELVPDHPNSHDSYAELFQFSGMFDEAIKHYNAAIALDPAYFAGYTGLAEAHTLAGNGDEGRKYLAKAREHASSDPQRANIKRLEANTYFAEGNGEAGLRMLRNASAELATTYNKGLAAQAYRELAVAEALFGDTGQVAAHLETAAELVEPGAGQYAWSSVAYALIGNERAARSAATAFDEATGGDNQFSHTLAGGVALAGGDTAAAERALVKSGLDDPWARAFMVRCQKEMGRMAEANALERKILADTEFTVGNFGYTLSRLTLLDHGVGHIRAGLDLN